VQVAKFGFGGIFFLRAFKLKGKSGTIIKRCLIKKILAVSVTTDLVLTAKLK
jgi:hypothetical protein